MKDRVIFGLILFGIMVSVMFLSQYVAKEFYDAFVLFLMLASGYEMSKAIGHKYNKPMFALVVTFILIGYATFKAVHEFNATMSGRGFGGITAFFVVLVMMFLVCFVVNMASEKHTFENVISTLICMIYPVGIMVYFLGLNYFEGAEQGLAFTGWVYDTHSTGLFVPNYRAIAIATTFASSAGADIFALFTGMIFKGPKLAPTISPKKTVSGAIGGLFGGAFGAGVVMLFANFGLFGLTAINEDMVINAILYMTLGVSIAFATELGDLMASYIKRFCGIKDFGTLIPGHGGILDRIDGTLIAAMVSYLFINMTIYWSQLG